jgi:phosphoserine phosphatase RsbU/P
MTTTACIDGEAAAAAQLQRLLLPPSPLTAHGWTAVHHFEPAGLVSGDYVDLVPYRDRLHFMLGDASGKGAPASLVMARLHAMFRTLMPFELTLDELITRASSLLCANSLPGQYATLVAGYLTPDGNAVIANAGHPPPLVIAHSGYADVRATGVPMGMFCDSAFTTEHLTFSSGDTLLIYSDGLTEARNPADEEYGAARLERAASAAADKPIADLLSLVIRDQAAFRAGAPNGDDVSVLAIRRV